MNLEGNKTSIRDNLNRVLKRIEKAAKEAGRVPGDIRLVVVTKTHPVDVVREVIEAGATDLGENYVEEAIPKIQALTAYPGVSWHMIGHVQGRKAQAVVEYFNYVHSVDSVKLAERLNQFALLGGKTVPVWLEFNVGGEETKSGWNISGEADLANITTEVEKILLLPGLKLLGMMTVPPYSTDPEHSRPYYRKLRQFQLQLINRFQLTGFGELSMGMSSDFEVAIQEGSTCVRIGQAILGPRP